MTSQQYDRRPRIYSAIYSQTPVFELQVGKLLFMRQISNGFVNATTILTIAGMSKSKRTKILETEVMVSDVQYFKVQGGYSKFQGTWVSLRVGKHLAYRYGVLDKVRYLVDFDGDIDKTIIKTGTSRKYLDYILESMKKKQSKQTYEQFLLRSKFLEQQASQDEQQRPAEPTDTYYYSSVDRSSAMVDPKLQSFQPQSNNGNMLSSHLPSPTTTSPPTTQFPYVKTTNMTNQTRPDLMLRIPAVGPYQSSMVASPSMYSEPHTVNQIQYQKNNRYQNQSFYTDSHTGQGEILATPPDTPERYYVNASYIPNANSWNPPPTHVNPQRMVKRQIDPQNQLPVDTYDWRTSQYVKTNPMMDRTQNYDTNAYYS